MMPPFRIGIGYDVHRTTARRPLILGGVHIESEFGLLGHSDADVLSHAIADAILGAAGLPDIGHYFPPNDPQWEGMDSQVILQKARMESMAIGYRLGNVDAVVIAEAPRIGPHLRAIKNRLARTLALDPAQVGIKATTNEQLGSLGKREGIAAQAVALLFLSQ